MVVRQECQRLTVLRLFEYLLETSSIINITKTAIALNLSYDTVSSAIETLQNAGILIANKTTSLTSLINAYECLAFDRCLRLLYVSWRMLF